MNRVIPNRRKEREELKKAKHDIAKLHLMLEQAEQELELARVELSKVEEPDIAQMQRGYQIMWSGICIICPILETLDGALMPVVHMVLSTVLFINLWVAHAKRGAEQICFYRVIAVMRIPILLNAGNVFRTFACYISHMMREYDGSKNTSAIKNEGLGTSLMSNMIRQMLTVGKNDKSEHIPIMQEQLKKLGMSQLREGLPGGFVRELKTVMKCAPMVVWSLFIIWICLEMFVLVQWCTTSFFHDDHTQDENPEPEVELAGHADVDPQDIDNPPQPPVDVALNVQPEDAPAPIKAAPDQENDDAPAADVDPEQV